MGPLVNRNQASWINLVGGRGDWKWTSGHQNSPFLGSRKSLIHLRLNLRPDRKVKVKGSWMHTGIMKMTKNLCSISTPHLFMLKARIINERWLNIPTTHTGPGLHVEQKRTMPHEKIYQDHLTLQMKLIVST